jgi:hypothetical protein
MFLFSACITSMIRLRYIFETESSVDLTCKSFMFPGSLSPLCLRSDSIWTGDYVDLTIWSIIEVFSAVICSCLISLRPLLVRYFPKLLPVTQHSANFNSAQNPNWNPRLSSKLTGKLQSGNRGVELLSEDEMRDRKVGFVNISATQTTSSIELNSPASSTKQTV